MSLVRQGWVKSSWSTVSFHHFYRLLIEEKLICLMVFVIDILWFYKNFIRTGKHRKNIILSIVYLNFSLRFIEKLACRSEYNKKKKKIFVYLISRATCVHRELIES